MKDPTSCDTIAAGVRHTSRVVVMTGGAHNRVIEGVQSRKEPLSCRLPLCVVRRVSIEVVGVLDWAIPPKVFNQTRADMSIG
jgi:hypothetical protein